MYDVDRDEYEPEPEPDIFADRPPPYDMRGNVMDQTPPDDPDEDDGDED